MQTYVSRSENETKKIAEDFAKTAKGNIFALSGELGAGKTTFVQGFAKGLGIKEKILSPTFVITRQHKIPDTSKVFYHIDLYRLENFNQLGFEEILLNKNSVVLIEWGEKIKSMLPKNTIKINITKEGPYSRLISISIDPNFSEDKSSMD
ncbi:tRNA (adenosine(37)-N6)-threonylcarbamoyltransferase complex ATPase subunit type 1 TsaE [Patescibacteria group bacterium]|nr:tRNA (adenosine(37)-N6)-threonylcarbamoyltransferase complex ATPase subunit type 1 TsaE [Patescibacteria group bacterium]